MAEQLTYNLTHIRGDTTQFMLNFFDDDGLPVVLELSWLAAWLVEDPALPVTTKITEFDITLAPANGTNAALFTILPTAPLVAGTTYYYDVQLTRSPTSVITPVRGAVTVIGDITEGVDQV